MSKSNLYDNQLLSGLRQTVTVSTERANRQDGVKFNTVDSNSGLFNTLVPQPRVHFAVAANSMILERKGGNAQMVLGSDRPAGKASGYGGKGAMKANTIDLVVGRGAIIA